MLPNASRKRKYLCTIRPETGVSHLMHGSIHSGKHIERQPPTLSFPQLLPRICYENTSHHTSIVDRHLKIGHQLHTDLPHKANLQTVRNYLRIMSDYIDPTVQDDWMNLVNWELDDPDWAGMLDAAAQAR